MESALQEQPELVVVAVVGVACSLLNRRMKVELPKKGILVEIFDLKS